MASLTNFYVSCVFYRICTKSRLLGVGVNVASPLKTMKSNDLFFPISSPVTRFYVSVSPMPSSLHLSSLLPPLEDITFSLFSIYISTILAYTQVFTIPPRSVNRSYLSSPKNLGIPAVFQQISQLRIDTDKIPSNRHFTIYQKEIY